MKKCNSCNIEFNINDKICPLCQNILIGECNDLMFPTNARYKTNSLIKKIVLFSSITIFLIFAFIEFLVVNNLTISSYIGVGLITNYVIMSLILKNYHNIYKVFGKYGLTIIVLLIIWYLLIKSPVITNYIIPSVCIFELLFNFIVALILRKNYSIKYSSQIIMNIFLLILPIIFVWLKLTTNNIMSYICCLLSVISITGLLIFSYNDIKEELSKLFNV
ncbi:MAG: hypothetical protein IJE89_05625 [Bacilli bacterium]|nr:hypothetical protein [Bacilli bacterium]